MRNKLFLLAAAAAMLAGCRQDMHDTPRYEPYEASTFHADGRASRGLPVGTVARGQLRDDDWAYTGKVNGEFVDAFPFAIGHAELQRGQERYNAYCTPCHGRVGDGQGMVVQRGLRQAASYHQERLREEKVGYFFDVITNGFGAMQSYAEAVPVRDRWLIVAYLRALQLSQYATIADVPAEHRAELEANAPRRDGAPGAPAAAAPAPKTEH